MNALEKFPAAEVLIPVAAPSIAKRFSSAKGYLVAFGITVAAIAGGAKAYDMQTDDMLDTSAKQICARLTDESFAALKPKFGPRLLTHIVQNCPNLPKAYHPA